jgi:hypothetical protein
VREMKKYQVKRFHGAAIVVTVILGAYGMVCQSASAERRRRLLPGEFDPCWQSRRILAAGVGSYVTIRPEPDFASRIFLEKGGFVRSR